MDKIINYNQAQHLVSALQQFGKKVIFRSGCFDMLHIAHIAMLETAKSYADILIVGIGSNKTVLEDRNHTFFDENNRAKTIAALGCVDYVVILHEEHNGNIDHYEFLKEVRPDFFYVSSSDKQKEGKENIAKELEIKIIFSNEVSIMNYGKEVQPHSTEIKKLLL